MKGENGYEKGQRRNVYRDEDVHAQVLYVHDFSYPFLRWVFLPRRIAALQHRFAGGLHGVPRLFQVLYGPGDYDALSFIS